MRRVYVNSTWLSGGLATAQGLTALAYWLVARTLGPNDFGQLIALVSVAMLVIGVADFGFGGWVVRELARDPGKTVLAESVGLRVIIALVAGLGWILVTIVLWAFGVAPGYAVFLGSWMILSMVWTTLLAPLRAQERMAKVVVVTVLERVMLVLVVLAAIAFGHPESALILGLVLGALCSTVLAAALIDDRAIARPSFVQAGQFLSASFGFAASSLALQLQRLDVALVGLVSGSFAAGIYAAPSRLTTTLSILPTGLSAALFPHTSKQTGSIWTREFRRLLLFSVLTMLIIETPIFIFAEPLTVTLLGQDYAESAPVLRVVLIATLVSSVNQPIATSYQARGDEHYVAIAMAIGMTVGLGAIAIGASMYGATGAAFGYLILQVVTLIALLLRAIARSGTHPTTPRRDPEVGTGAW